MERRCPSVTVPRSGCATRPSWASSRSSGSNAWSSSPTSPTSVAAMAATTRTTSSSATGSPSSPLPAPRGSRLSAGTPTGFPSFDADPRVTPAVGKHGTPVHIRDRQRHRTEGKIRMEKFSLTALARQQLTLAQAGLPVVRARVGRHLRRVRTRGPPPTPPGGGYRLPRLHHRARAWREDYADAGASSSRTSAAFGTRPETCLLYTSDAADEEDSVDLGGRRI